MSKKDLEMLKILEKEGFPLERKIRRKLLKLGIETTQSRYFAQNSQGDVSKDIDVLGNVHFKTYKSSDNTLFPNLHLRIIGEIKKWSGSKICFYELDNEKPGNLLLRFPNFLNNVYQFENYRGGEITASEFLSLFASIPLSKTVTCLIQENTKLQPKGNAPLYLVSNDLALACEYLHQKEYLNCRDDLKIHACFPIVFTDAEIFHIKGINKLSARKVNLFMYLVACTDLDKVPVTTKEKYYLPILVVNQRGIKRAVEIINKISKDLSNDLEELTKTPQLLKNEYDDYKKICLKSPKEDIMRILKNAKNNN